MNKQGRYGLQNFFISLLVAIVIIVIFVVIINASNVGGFALMISAIVAFIFYMFMVAFLIAYSPRARNVRRPMIREIIREVEKPLMIEEPIKEDVPLKKKGRVAVVKANYVGSTQTRTYHTNRCRLGKLIKSKYRLSDNDTGFFKKRKFKACKICIRKLRKV
jgi:hypothetical protein